MSSTTKMSLYSDYRRPMALLWLLSIAFTLLNSFRASRRRYGTSKEPTYSYVADDFPQYLPLGSAFDNLAEMVLEESPHFATTANTTKNWRDSIPPSLGYMKPLFLATRWAIPLFLTSKGSCREATRYIDSVLGSLLDTVPPEPTKEGTVPFIVNGEEFQTYYQVHGDLADGSLSPLIAVHGGPGLTHDYLGPIADISKSNPLQPVIFYDQLGNGKSSRLVGKPITFFSVQLYVDELANFWGGPLVAEFEVQFQLPGLKSLIITNSLFSMELTSQSFNERIDTLDNPDQIREDMGKMKTDVEAYRAAMMAFYSRYALRFVKEDPIPKELRILDTMIGDEETGEGGDPTVSDAMGPLTANWTIIGRIHLIRVPLFLITGKEDMVQSYVSEPYFWGVPGKVKWVEFQKSSHVPFWEEREKFMQLVGEWIRSVD
ncbi:hypothetical protein D9611_012853 [Ephemerocybe angulata]|uniref:AB hydrolase-1 domain-containing protein n=1 Tax=Ephemerocybe angulata TaxID=980116 RepID=A0A8H5BAQ1_9AGAR|nr:hypothetical protein D9611_012853 [Tulosesus angulatus]